MKLQRIIRLSVSMIIITSIFTPSGVFSVQADAPDVWWDEDWPYRVPLTIEGGGNGGSFCHCYPYVCIPYPPPDLDCADVPYSNFAVIGCDPHRFDGDDDGIGCER
ncbi:MAG: hypothetical protein ACTSQ8_22975 [Candidatus Helarchaeota archaeon]